MTWLDSVSTHAPVWGATVPGREAVARADVSTHAPVWGATRDGLPEGLGAAVSTHAPVWGATCSTENLTTGCEVSTHAPVWGATAIEADKATGKGEFQPTLPCGERPARKAGGTRPPCFNPRSRLGSDVGSQSRRHCLAGVSTHAPVWGATGVDTPSCATVAAFQPTLPCGERRIRRSWSPLPGWFQPTLPCGERLPEGPGGRRHHGRWFQPTLPCGERRAIRCAVGRHVNSFNPRSRVGSDGSPIAEPTLFCRFQPTLPCGERRGASARQAAGAHHVSTHAPVWGATLYRAGLT